MFTLIFVAFAYIESQVIYMDTVPTSVSDIRIFKSVLEVSVASVMNIDNSFVNVTKIKRNIASVVTRVEQEISSLSVEYTVKSIDGTSASTLVSILDKAIDNGLLVSRLTSGGLSGVVVSAAVVTNISPTFAPTYSPTYVTTTVKDIASIQSSTILGVLAGVGGVFVLVGAIFLCRRLFPRSKVYIIDTAVEVEDEGRDLDKEISPAYIILPYRVPLIGPELKV